MYERTAPAVVEIHLDRDSTYPTDPVYEAESIARGWTPAWFVRAEFPRDPDNPRDAVYFDLAASDGRGPETVRRYESRYDLTTEEEALAVAADAEARGAVLISITEISAANREDSAAERAFEARVS